MNLELITTVEIQVPEAPLDFIQQKHLLAVRYCDFIDIYKISTARKELETICRFERTQVKKYLFSNDLQHLFVLDNEGLWSVSVQFDSEQILTKTFTGENLQLQADEFELSQQSDFMICCGASLLQTKSFKIVQEIKLQSNFHMYPVISGVLCIQTDNMLLHYSPNDVKIQPICYLTHSPDLVASSPNHIVIFAHNSVQLFEVEPKPRQQAQIDLGFTPSMATITTYSDSQQLRECAVFIHENQLFALPLDNFSLQGIMCCECDGEVLAVSTDYVLTISDDIIRTSRLSVFRQQDASNIEFMLELSLPPHTYSLQFGDEDSKNATIKEDGEIVPLRVIKLDAENCFNPDHPKITAKRAQLLEQKKKDKMSSKPVMYHKPAPRVDTKLIMSQKHSAKLARDKQLQNEFKKSQITVPKTLKKQQMTIIDQVAINGPPQKMCTNGTDLIAQYNNQIDIIDVNRKMTFKTTIQLDLVPDKIQINQFGSQIIAGCEGGFKLYDVESKQPINFSFEPKGYDPKVYTKYQPQLLSFVWPNHQSKAIIVSTLMNQLYVSYAQLSSDKFQQFAIKSLCEMTFKTTVQCGVGFANAMSPHVLLGFSTVSDDENSVVIWDLFANRRAMGVKSCKQVNQIAVFDSQYSHSNVFALQQQSTGISEVSLFDIRVRDQIRSFQYPNNKRKQQGICFTSPHKLAVVCDSGVGIYDMSTGFQIICSEKGGSVIGTGRELFVGRDGQVVSLK